MNAKQLRKWKDGENARSDLLCKALSVDRRPDIVDFYPEFRFSTSLYSTSLEPRVPLWAQIPFFRVLIVGILPYLKTEREFEEWYGITPGQMRWLHEQGKLHLRILYPDAATTIPKYLTPFFELGLPSTLRDMKFTDFLLGGEAKESLSSRFANSTDRFTWTRSIDSRTGNPTRARLTALRVYLQLHSLEYGYKADQFDWLASTSEDVALKWLEMCRLFLVGPIHYSLNGIHSVAYDIVERNSLAEDVGSVSKSVYKFPSDLGRVLVELCDLVQKSYDRKTFTLRDVVDYYENSEIAHRSLTSLHEMLGKGSVSAEALEEIRVSFGKAKKWDALFMRSLRLVAAVAVGAAASSVAGEIGLLSALGFEIVAELPSKPMDRILGPIRRVLRRPAHLALLLELDDDVRRCYRRSETLGIGR